MKNLLILTILAAFAALAPNGWAQKGGVAVLDIDKVAQELGVDKAVLGELQKIEADLNTQLGQIRTNLQSQMNQLEAQAGQQRTQQVQAQLVNANQQLNAQFNNVKAQAQNQLAAARIAKINEFREKLEPLALEAAKAKGLGVVLTKTPQVYAYDEALDITDDTIKRAKAAGLETKIEESAAPTPAPAPAAAPETGESSAKPTDGAAPAPAPAAPPAGNN
ncbi:MAG: OmpH family outer membrane protein [Verrucomicrobiae bacterium]|nr:OmpH family outer membrane protein [Verrucomicrobiae bacterium]MCP5539787.1 OmpH family outer membrane protein [Akkermansiaceae bacterium]